MIKALIRTFLIIVILLIALAAFLLTPSGLRFSFDVAAKILPGQLTYQKISGVIIGPINIDQLRYENNDKIIDIGKLHLDWQPINLFKKQLSITALSIQQLNIITPEEIFPAYDDEKTIKTSISDLLLFLKHKTLLLHLVIQHAEIAKLMVKSPTSQALFEKIQLHSVMNNKNWDVQLFSTIKKPQTAEAHFQLTGTSSHYLIYAGVKGEETHWVLQGVGNQKSFSLHAKNIKFNMRWNPILNWHGKFTSKTILIDSKGKIDGDIIHIHLLATHHLPYKKTRSLIIDVHGTLQNHTVDAKLKFPRRKMHLIINGHYHNQKWNGTLKQLTFILAHTNIWKLQNPILLTATENTGTIAPACLTAQSAGKVCFQAEWENKKMNADLQMNMNHFGWIGAWTRDIRIPSGNMIAKINIDGLLQKPNITGSLNLHNGSISIPKANITLNRVGATMAEQNHQLHFTVLAYSRQQPVQLKGWIQFLWPDFLANAALTMNNAMVMNTDQYVIYTTTNLIANIKNNNIFLTGKIHIPNAVISPNDFHATITLPDNDIVYTNKERVKSEPFWQMHMNVLGTVGNNVQLHAFGIHAQLGGTINLTQQPDHELFGTGAITVRHGKYKVYGQTLIIEPRSSLIFTDSLLNNPGLNLKATKTVKTINSFNSIGVSDYSQRKIMVGIEMHGTIKEPKIAFFSNRSSLSQSDILSYLLLGYSNESNTPGNTDLLLRGLAAINISSQGLMGKENIASQIQSGLGLSEMGVESETTSDVLGNPLNRQSAFVVGKHLTKKLYVRYSIGLLDPVDVFEIRYLLNDNWFLQGDSSTLGNDVGADIFYTIQKN